MPFNVSDVSKYNKRATTQKQKEQWASVANSVLYNCEKRKGQNCDVLAIKTANGTLSHLDKQIKPLGFEKSTSNKVCRNCQYFNLEWCELYNYPTDEHKICRMWMPIFKYRNK